MQRNCAIQQIQRDNINKSFIIKLTHEKCKLSQKGRNNQLVWDKVDFSFVHNSRFRKFEIESQTWNRIKKQCCCI